MPLARVQSLNLLLMSTWEPDELDRTSKSASRGSGTLEAASRSSRCSEEHIDFLFSGLSVPPSSSAWPCRVVGVPKNASTPIGLTMRSARTRLPAQSRSRRTEAHHSRSRASLGARSSSLSFHESVSALRGEPRRTSREGLEPSRARWAAAGRPWGLRRAFGGVPTVCLRALPSAVTNRRCLTLLRRAR